MITKQEYLTCLLCMYIRTNELILTIREDAQEARRRHATHESDRETAENELDRADIDIWEQTTKAIHERVKHMSQNCKNQPTEREQNTPTLSFLTSEDGRNTTIQSARNL